MALCMYNRYKSNMKIYKMQIYFIQKYNNFKN